MSNKHTEESVTKELESYGYRLVEYVNSKEIIFICKCGQERKTSFLRIRSGQKCRSCKNITEFSPVDTPDEKWVKYADRWISSNGKVLLENGKEASIDKSGDRQRFTSNILGNLQVNRAMAIAFKIPNYEYLENKNNLNNYEVAFKDNNKDNLCIDNLIIIHKKENILRRTQCHFYNNRVISAYSVKESDIKDNFEVKTLDEYPDYKFYSNGMIFRNGYYQAGAIKNYCSSTFIKDDKTPEAIKSYRLICMAFHPIEGKTKYDDYNDLQVNHKDGNPQNNAADNLEWCTQSENQLHKNKSITKGNQQVNMYDSNTEKLLKEFVSISEASRFLYDEEYGKFVATDNEEELEKYRKKCNCLQTKIRCRASGKSAQSGKYVWKFADEEKRKKFQEKYAKHV